MREQQESGTAEEAGAAELGTAREVKPNLARDIALYTVARLGMVAAVTALLVQTTVPLLVALAVAVVVVMPLSLLVFGKLRRRVAVGMAERTAERRARREELRAQLRGDRATEAP